MGETLARGHFFDRWQVRRAGTLIFAESLRLDDAIAERLSQRAVAGSAVAIASVLKIPGDEAAVAAVRAKEKDFAGEVGVSAWNGVALARLVAHRRRRAPSRPDCRFDRIRQYAAAEIVAELTLN